MAMPRFLPQCIRVLGVTLTIVFMTSVLTTLASAQSSSVAVLPDSIKLDRQGGIQQVTAVKLNAGKVGGSVDSEDCSYKVADPTIASVSGGVVTALKNGSTELICTIDGQTLTIPIEVQFDENAQRWSFSHDVQSVMSKAGCNMGACHGALAGKGGFRLSLRGYDNQHDFMSITRAARGRRIEMADPGRSLLLAKPTGAIAHKGGVRLDVDSRDYEILSQWIADGAAGPDQADAQLERISVTPDQSMLAVGDKSQILVRAHYDDGRAIDVTHWAKFSATDQAIATVDEDGHVTVQGSGESAILVWFGSKVALARLTVPYTYEIPDSVYKQAATRNFIDEINLGQLQTLRLQPSPRCDDEAFLRRSTLDTIGRLPTDEERKTFNAFEPQKRRDRWIEHLLASDDYVAYWSYKWSDLLLINGTRLRPNAVKSYYQWVRSRVAENQPWDQFVSEILTATGRSDENGATNFYALHQSPEDMTENACQAFMGLSIGCAKCHNHPLEKWTNDQYYAMANLFARVRAKGWGGDGRNGDGLRTLYVATNGELIQPNRGKPQPPAPLDQEPIPFESEGDRRVVLADWMTNKDNPYFARSISNRIWANFFGQGLVEQVDDLRLSNPASNEALMDAISQHLIEQKFDVKQLMKTIMQSETYQRSSIALDTNRDEQKYNSRYYPKRLMAEVLLDSIDQVLGTSTTFNQVAYPGADKQKTDFYKSGTRAIELYDSAVESYFLKTFGRNPREITCECERSDEPSMVQVLHLSNGDTLNPKLEAKDNRIDKAIAAEKDDAAIIRELFLSALCREPTDSEQEKMLNVIKEYGPEERLTALRDAAWSILTSTEFTFNH